MACGVICWDISVGHREVEFRLGVGKFKPGRSRWPGNKMTNNCLSTQRKYFRVCSVLFADAVNI